MKKKWDIILIALLSSLLLNCFPSLERLALEYVSVFSFIQRDRNPTQNGILEGVPTFSPGPGEFYDEIDVVISSELSNSRIYFTTNGTEPGCPELDSSGEEIAPATGEEYSSPISIPQPTLVPKQIQAIACANRDGRQIFTQIASASYIVTNGLLYPPTRNLPPNIYTSQQSLTLTPPPLPSDVEIRYTINGAQPNCNSQLYISPIQINQSKTVRAISCLTNWSSSNELVGYYEITGTVETPLFSLDSDTYNNDQMLFLNTNTTGTNIRYAMSVGGDPDLVLNDCNDGIPYSSPIALNQDNTRVIAIGCRDNWDDSNVSPLYTYNFEALSPVLSPTGGVYQTDITVTGTSATSGTNVFYSISGTPVCDVNPDPIELLANQISETILEVTAIACRNGYISSGVSIANYTVTGTLPSPISTPDPGIVYSDPINVELDFDPISPSGSFLRYTDNGTDPDCTTNGNDYTGSFPVSSTTQIRAIDCKLTPLWNPSPPLVVTYTIGNTVANPTFSSSPGLESGIYANDQFITIDTATPGATIFYTLGDGTQSEPACPGTGNSYITPVPITDNNNNVIKAIACFSGFDDSSVETSPVYELKAATPEPDISPGTYFTETTINFTSATDLASIHYTINGSSADCGSPLAPAVIPLETGSVTLRAVACKSDYTISDTFQASYTVTGTVSNPSISAPSGVSNSITLTPNAPPLETSQTICYRIGGTPQCASAPDDSPETTGGFCASGSNPYSVPIPFDTGGILRARSCSNGYFNSNVVEWEVLLPNTVGNVVIAPDPTIERNESDTFSLTATNSSLIYYTLTGNNPTCQGDGDSIAYSTPILIDANLTINAIGCAEGFAASPITTENTNFKVGQPDWVNDPAQTTFANPITMEWDFPTVADYYFRTDGTAPDCSNTGLPGTNLLSSTLDLPIPGNNGNLNFQIRGCRNGFTQSDVLFLNLSMEVGAIDVTSAFGYSILDQTLETNRLDLNFLSQTIDSNICYNFTTNGSNPPNPACNLDGSCNGGTLYNGSDIDLNQNTNFRIIGCKEGFLASPVIIQNFLFNGDRKRIFRTSQVHPGNLSTANADNACNSDLARPSSNLNYKALRMGSDRNLTEDWVLDSATTYYNIAGRSIGQTLTGGTGFLMPFTNSIYSFNTDVPTAFAWTGFHVDSITGLITASDNCNNWTDNGRTTRAC